MKKSGSIILVVAIIICVIATVAYLKNGNLIDSSNNLVEDVNNLNEEGKDVIGEDGQKDDEAGKEITDENEEKLNEDNKEIIDESGEKVDVTEKQIDVVFSNKTLWNKDTEFEKYSYAVTDLDQNGRIEIITSICQGTGMYTTTTIYEVNESMDGLNLCESNLEEYDSGADIIKNNWKVFYDKSNNKYHYVFEDLTRNGATEYYENKRDFCLNDGKITETYLVRKDTIYESDLPKVTCTDLNGNEITEEQYKNFEDEFFTNYEKMNVNIEWLSNYNEIGMEDLQNSYNKFGIIKNEL